jgi:uncharacterized protein
MSKQQDILRPDPVPTPDSQFFWDAAEREELMGQQCNDCGAYLHPPRPMCPHCNSLKQNHVKLSGRGTVYSCRMPRHPQIPIFEYPLVTALIDLEEGIRLLSNVVGCDVYAVQAGMAVEVDFAPTSGGKKVPVFKPLEASGRDA